MSDNFKTDGGLHGDPPFDPAQGSAAPVAYIYLVGRNGQMIQGHFDRRKLLKLVKHFIACEAMDDEKHVPPNAEVSDGVGRHSLH